MKILKTEELNEKLNIKPVTKDRLEKTVGEIPNRLSKRYAVNFKTGDIVRMGKSYDSSEYAVYVSHSDMVNKTYDDILEFGLNLDNIINNDEYKDGMFVINYGGGFKRDMLSAFNENLSSSYLHKEIYEVYRFKGKDIKLDYMYFQRPPYEKAELIWKRN